MSILWIFFHAIPFSALCSISSGSIQQILFQSVERKSGRKTYLWIFDKSRRGNGFWKGINAEEGYQTARVMADTGSGNEYWADVEIKLWTRGKELCLTFAANVRRSTQCLCSVTNDIPCSPIPESSFQHP